MKFQTNLFLKKVVRLREVFSIHNSFLKSNINHSIIIILVFVQLFKTLNLVYVRELIWSSDKCLNKNIAQNISKDILEYCASDQFFQLSNYSLALICFSILSYIFIEGKVSLMNKVNHFIILYSIYFQFELSSSILNLALSFITLT